MGSLKMHTIVKSLGKYVQCACTLAIIWILTSALFIYVCHELSMYIIKFNISCAFETMSLNIYHWAVNLVHNIFSSLFVRVPGTGYIVHCLDYLCACVYVRFAWKLVNKLRFIAFYTLFRVYVHAHRFSRCKDFAHTSEIKLSSS